MAAGSGRSTGEVPGGKPADGASEPAGGRRAVLLVANPAAPYSRGLRVARSLAAAGWSVEIAATTGDDQPTHEEDGAVVIRRYRPWGRWARFATGSPSRARRRPLDRVAGLLEAVRKAVAWPIHVRGWWSALDRELPPADLYHAFGILTIPVALRLARRARRSGRAGCVVYDVIDVILDSNNVARLPKALVLLYKARERGWVRRADAIVTVNAPIADHLERIWPLRTRPTVLLNCPPRWHPPAVRPDLIRAATGVPPERGIVLFLGRIGRERGLAEAAEAVLQLRDAALVLLGFGPWADRSRERDRDPRFAGRHFTLPPVHPDDVPAWAASADTTIIAVPANSLNQRLSTPNKLWESLAAGTPMVVGRELTVMSAIVTAEAIGVVADPTDPADLAAGLRRILEVSDSERSEMRERVLAAAERYTWESAVVPYLDLVATLVPWRRSP